MNNRAIFKLNGNRKNLQSSMNKIIRITAIRKAISNCIDKPKIENKTKPIIKCKISFIG